jgi:UDP-N-acetylglucosamine transferase subunit ALG13
LSVSRRPILFPRLASLREAVDDHQVAFARRLAASGLALLAEDVESLRSTVASTMAEEPIVLERGALAGELQTYIRQQLGSNAGPIQVGSDAGPLHTR